MACPLQVAAGSLNRDGVLVLRALRLAEESTPARIARLTLDAQVRCSLLGVPAGDGAGELGGQRVCAAADCPRLMLMLMLLPQGAAASHHLQAKRPQLRTWLDQFGEVYSKAVVGAAVAVLAGLLATGVPLLGAAGQVRRAPSIGQFG